MPSKHTVTGSSPVGGAILEDRLVKVKELIKQLESMDQDAVVCICSESIPSGFAELSSVEEHQFDEAVQLHFNEE